jgi:hypothetical protein
VRKTVGIDFDAKAWALGQIDRAGNGPEGRLHEPAFEIMRINLDILRPGGGSAEV